MTADCGIPGMSESVTTYYDPETSASQSIGVVDPTV